MRAVKSRVPRERERADAPAEAAPQIIQAPRRLGNRLQEHARRTPDVRHAEAMHIRLPALDAVQYMPECVRGNAPMQTPRRQPGADWKNHRRIFHREGEVRRIASAVPVRADNTALDGLTARLCQPSADPVADHARVFDVADLDLRGIPLGRAPHRPIQRDAPRLIESGRPKRVEVRWLLLGWLHRPQLRHAEPPGRVEWKIMPQHHRLEFLR